MHQEKLVKCIDTADASTSLTKDQIIALRSLVPTPQEEQLITSYLSHAELIETPRPRIPARGEKFMMRLVGIGDLKRKLEALFFQREFLTSVEQLRTDCRLFQSACEEVESSQRLQKVLGIVNLLGNRLVEKAPGRKKTSKISMQELLNQLDEIESYSDFTTAKSSSQPFLLYACSRIQRTNPSLLNLREDMPSLALVVDRLLDWNVLRLKLEELEARFEDFRKLAISLSSYCPGTSEGVGNSAISVEDEIDVLQTTPIGSFAVNACLRMASLYETVDATERAYEALTAYFSEDGDTLLRTVSRFCDFVGT